jgi:hypothetical protein
VVTLSVRATPGYCGLFLFTSLSCAARIPTARPCAQSFRSHPPHLGVAFHMDRRTHTWKRTLFALATLLVTSSAVDAQ